MKYVVGTLAMVVLLSSLVVACPGELVCGNFTQYEKVRDCEYLVEHDLEYEEEQAVLCLLWDQTYGSFSYQTSEYGVLDTDLTLEYGEVRGNRIALVFRVGLFLLFNYAVFSVLTKPSRVRRWFSL